MTVRSVVLALTIVLLPANSLAQQCTPAERASGVCFARQSFPKVVRVLSTECGGLDTRSSNGFIVEVPGGEEGWVYIVTTRHSIPPDVEGCGDSVRVQFAKPPHYDHFAPSHGAEIVATHNEADLALLRVRADGTDIRIEEDGTLSIYNQRPRHRFKPFVVSDTSPTHYVGRRRGRDLVTVDEITVTVESATRLWDKLPPGTQYRLQDADVVIPWVYTDVLAFSKTMMPGISGSPLIDKDGNVVGVIEGGLGQGISWAIPARALKELLELESAESIPKRALALAERHIYSGQAAKEMDADRRRQRFIVTLFGAIIPVSDQVQGGLGVRLEFAADLGGKGKRNAALASIWVVGGVLYDRGLEWFAPNGVIVASSGAKWQGLVGAGFGVGAHLRRQKPTVVDLIAGVEGGYIGYRNYPADPVFVASIGRIRMSHYPHDRSTLAFGVELFGGGIRMQERVGNVNVDQFDDLELDVAFQPWLGIGGSIVFR